MQLLNSNQLNFIRKMFKNARQKEPGFANQGGTIVMEHYNEIININLQIYKRRLTLINCNIVTTSFVDLHLT